MTTESGVRTTFGRGRLFSSILDTVGDTPTVRINNLGVEHAALYVEAEFFNPGCSNEDRPDPDILAAAGAEVAHPRRVADLVDVVDRNTQPLAEVSGPGRATGRATGPFAVCGHQDDGQRCDPGLGLDEGLDARALGRPLQQIPLISGSARGGTAAATKSVK